MIQSFKTLTKRGRAQRLRPLALDALKHYDFKVSKLTLLGNDFNCMFRVDTTHGHKYALRIVLPELNNPTSHYQVEAAWLTALNQQTDIPIAEPIPTKDGRFIITASAPGVPENRMCMLFNWAPGKTLEQEISPSNVEKVGRLAARLHQHAKTFKLPKGLSTFTYDKLLPFGEPLVMFKNQHKGLFTQPQRKRFKQTVDLAQQSIDRLTKGSEPMRILHGDLHQWNILIHRGQLTPIDFEDLRFGWPVQDIGILFFYYAITDHYQEYTAAFKRGYTQIAPWPEKHPREIQSFAMLRGIDLINFILVNPESIANAAPQKFIPRMEKRLNTILGQPSK